MHRVYQSTLRILAAQIIGIELIADTAQLAVKVDTGETFTVPATWATANAVQVGGYLGMAGKNEQGQAYFIPAAAFEVDFAYVGDLPAPAAAAGAPEPASYTFEQFIEYGINAGGNVVEGMPWSFTFHGRPVSHENNDRYLITTKEGKTLNFYRGEVITVGEDDALTITLAPGA